MGGLFAGIGYGTALFWVLVFVVLFAVLLIVVLTIRNRRINKLRREPRLRIQEDGSYTDPQIEAITELLADTGYAYDWQQNIYYSVLNPWQRKLGYCSLYDEWATPLGMVFDCEPVRFEYNGKKWLVEFWKGQYGITVGAEIGIYNTTGPDLAIPGVFKGTFYHSAGDDEDLDMAFTLLRDGEAFFTRADKHWWLTGFTLGEYCEPSSLTLEASVTFRDLGMQDAFIDALRKLGYRQDDIKRSDDTVTFLFAKPRSKQPAMRKGPVKYMTMIRVRALVAEYRKLTSGLTNMYDILMTLRDKSPLLYYLAINIGKPKELFKSYETIRKYLD